MKRLFAAAVMATIVLMAQPAAAQQYPPTGDSPDGPVDIEVVAGGAGAPANPAADAGGTGTPAAAPAEDDASGTLPRTGDDSSIPLAQIGLSLAAVGGVVTAFASQRRRSAAAAA